MPYCLQHACHNNKAVNEQIIIKKKEIGHLYSSMKGGVAAFAEIVHNNSAAWKTHQWPMRIFYGVLKLSDFNVQCQQGYKTILSKDMWLKSCCSVYRELPTDLPVGEF
jgi:hypothetical protein